MPAEKVYTIAEITRSVRRLLEAHLGVVWVEGEVSNHRAQASGHQYFTLKDDKAQLNCVLFRGNARNSIPLENGLQVQASGEVTVYEARGQYQLIVRSVQLKGQGALQAKFEALKKKLDAEGIFDPAIKKPIPEFPRTIAIVTSPTGAALRDILNIVERRAPWVRVIVDPVRVQGAGAEKEIAAAVQRITRESGHSLPVIDTLVVGRGGGSIEDLWNFNEEVVARAIHASHIPVVSAVGHEIDFTIADFASDLRAPTPSAAAELIVPDREELEARLRRISTLMRRQVTATVQHQERVLDLIERGALGREPLRVLREQRQQTDALAQDLLTGASNTLEQFRTRLGDAGRLVEFTRPDLLVDRYRGDLDSLSSRLHSSVRHDFGRVDRRLRFSSGLLHALGPQAIFSRGFSMTVDEAGNTLTDASQLKAGQRIRTRLANGTVESDVVDS